MVDTEKSNLITEQLLQAMDIIASKKIENLPFDKTILCTITRVVNEDEGEYEVSFSSSQSKTTHFTAFAQEGATYSVDDNVYVNIPQNDFSNQKTIIRKYINDQTTPINYIYPMERFVKIFPAEEENQIWWNNVYGTSTIGASEEWSLKANGSKKETLIINKIFSNNINQFDCLGVSAQFKTLLREYDPIQGEYGLRFEFLGLKDGWDIDKENLEKYYVYKSDTFSNADMYGLVYGYDAYQKQEKLLNLQDFPYPIKGVRVYFYQDQQFLDVKGNPIPGDNKQVEQLDYVFDEEEQKYQESLKEVQISLPDDLFIKDLLLSFGYLVTNAQDKDLRLYTISQPQYAEEWDDETNKKTLKLRWLEENETGIFTVIDSLEDKIDSDPNWWNNKSIYLYKYTYGQDTVDEYAGPFWERVASYNDCIATGSIITTGDPASTITAYLNRPTFNGTASNGFGNPFEIVRYIDDNDKTNAFVRYKVIIVERDIELVPEAEYKIQGENHSVTGDYYLMTENAYTSNEVTFENRDESISKATMALIRGLTLECSDGSNGIYRVYGEDNKISAQLNVREMKLRANFEAINILNLDTGKTTITWQYPISNTMLLPPVDKIVYEYKKAPEGTDAEHKDEDGYLLDDNGQKIPSKIDEKHSVIWHYEYEDEVNAEGHSVEQEDKKGLSRYKTFQQEIDTGDYDKDNIENLGNEITYTISSFYSTLLNNNIIKCTIDRYGRKYEAEMVFSFGHQGNNGTNYAFDIAMERAYADNNGLPRSEPKSEKIMPFLQFDSNDWIKIQPTLIYGQEQIKNLNNIRWSWESISTHQITDKSGNIIYKPDIQVCTISGDTIASSGGSVKGSEIYIKHDLANKDRLSNYYGILKAELMKEVYLLDSANEENYKTVTLSTYLPIAISADSSIQSYSGGTAILYNDYGSDPVYFEGEHQLFDYSQNKISSLTWKFENSESTATVFNNVNSDSYYPTMYQSKTYKYDKVTNLSGLDLDNLVQGPYYVDNNGTYQKIYYKYTESIGEDGTTTLTKKATCLIDGNEIEYKKTSNLEVFERKDNSAVSNEWFIKPTSMYFSGIKNTGRIIVKNASNTILYVQPIFIAQNAWGNQTINQWDGALKVDAENNYILSSMIGAGIKNSNNTFSGVLLGKVGTNYSAKTGIYGYGNGVQTYGFREDGTAFIGASGAGRIEFDTKNDVGIIKGGYTSNLLAVRNTEGYAMKINLTDGSLVGTQKTATTIDGNEVYYQYIFSAAETTYPLQIGHSDNPNFKVAWDGTLYTTGMVIGDAFGLGDNNITVSSNNNSTIEDLLLGLYTDYIGRDAIDKAVLESEITLGDQQIQGNLNTAIASLNEDIANEARTREDEFTLRFQPQNLYNSMVKTIDLNGGNDKYFLVTNKTYGVGSSETQFLIQSNDSNKKPLFVKNLVAEGVVSAQAGQFGGWNLLPGLMHYGYNTSAYVNANCGMTWYGDFIQNWYERQKHNDQGQPLYKDSDGNQYTTNGTGREPLMETINLAELATSDLMDPTLRLKTNKSVTVGPTKAFIYLGDRGNGISIKGFAGNPYSNATSNNINQGYLKNIIFSLGKYFAVDKDGQLFANSGTFSGKVTATSGQIGGWTLNAYEANNSSKKGELTSTVAINSTNYTITLDPTGSTSKTINGASRSNLVFMAGTKFGVTSDGTLYANSANLSSATVSGILTAGSGSSIGPWVVSAASLYYKTGTDTETNRTRENTITDNSFCLYPSGHPVNSTPNIVLHIGKNFKVDKTGKLYASSVDLGNTLDNYVTNTEIGDYVTAELSDNETIVFVNKRFSNTNSNSGSQYYGTFIDSTHFKLENGNTVTPVYGNVNNYYIDKQTSKIYQSTQNSSSGNYYWTDISDSASSFTVSSKGLLTCVNAIITGTVYAGAGNIGGWKINNNVLENSDKSIYLTTSPDGSSYVYVFKVSDSFSVSSTGILSASGAVLSNGMFTGTLSAAHYQGHSTRFYMYDSTKTPKYNSSVMTCCRNISINGNQENLGFWKNALYGGFALETHFPGVTTTGEANYPLSYVGFLRGGGEDSNRPDNVFLGVKVSNSYILTLGRFTKTNSSGTEENIGYSNASNWDGTTYSRYRAFIKFNGQARFYSLTIGTEGENVVESNGNGSSTSPVNEYGIRHDGAGYFNSLYVKSLKGATGYLKVSQNGWVYDSNNSDERLKRNINCIKNNLNLLKFYDELIPISYYLRDDTKLSYGFSAQHVENLLLKNHISDSGLFKISEVSLEEDKKFISDNKLYSIDYQSFHALHVVKNQQQDARIQSLESEVASLRAELEQLKREKGGN